MPKSSGYILGINIGTSTAKASLYSSSGELFCESSANYSITTPSKGCFEQNPEAQWWEATVACIRKVIRGRAKKVIGVGVSSANALVCADKDGKALMPAIVQADKRALHEVKFISDKIGEEYLFSITGNRIATGTFFLPSILWLKENKGDVFKKCHKFLSPTGFIVNKLTGRFCMDTSTACATLLFDIKEKKWSGEILSLLGIDGGKMPDIYKPSDVVGEINEKASKATGLRKGTPVIAGCMDAVSEGIAMNANNREENFIVLGRVGKLCRFVTSQALLKKEFLNVIYADDGKFLSIACMEGTGVSLEWFAKEFGAKLFEKKTFENLEKEAQKSPQGSGGLLYLPYLLGEKSPIWDSYAKGVMFGISPSATRGDFYRAIIEGIAYAIKANIEVFEKDMVTDWKSVKLCESEAGKSKFIQQVISDVLKKEIIPCNVESPETLGISALTAIGIGIAKNTEKFVKNEIRIGKPVKPDKESAKRYDNMFLMFNKLYDDLKGDFRIMYEIQ